MNAEWDVLIMGNGLAALTLALSLPTHYRIAILCKNRLQHNASSYAQGGIAAVLDQEDSLENHIHDTLIAGAGLCDEAVVRQIVQQGQEAVYWLLQFAIPFDQNTDGSLHLTREGGHSMRRIAHVADHTGAAIMQGLQQALCHRPNIAVFERHMALDILKTPAGDSIGLRVLAQETRNITDWYARHTVLAGGGLGQIYPHTTTPMECTGDSIAMALRAGCEIKNIEFIQFHPTGLALPHQQQTFLISEAVRGEGGILRNQQQQRFMLAQHPLAELAPRDIVARAIASEINKQNQLFVWLDISHRSKEFIRHHFPNIEAHCLAKGIDITQQAIPVCPVQHYTCGGVATDIDGRTNIVYLWCLGEAACTGLHGANRLASNSLLECVVTARRAAQAIMQNHTMALPLSSPVWVDEHIAMDRNALQTMPLFHRANLHQVAEKYLGIQRSHQGLATADMILHHWRVHLPAPQTVEDYENYNLLLCAQAVCKAAMQQKHNIGTHYNIDLT